MSLPIHPKQSPPDVDAADDRALLAQLAALRELHPPVPDTLWAGIAERIQPVPMAAPIALPSPVAPAPRRRHGQRWALAASLVLALALGLMLPQWFADFRSALVPAWQASLHSTGNGEQQQLAALPAYGGQATPAHSAPSAYPQLPTAQATYAVSQRPVRHRLLRAESGDWPLPTGLHYAGLQRAGPKQASRPYAAPQGRRASLSPQRMDPALDALLSAHARLVRDAEREIRRAMARDPDDPELQALLEAVQQRRSAVELARHERR